ncbi:MAG: hypothetical protein ACOC0J_00965, partial [Myxococcota bacterium]
MDLGHAEPYLDSHACSAQAIGGMSGGGMDGQAQIHHEEAKALVGEGIGGDLGVVRQRNRSRVAQPPDLQVHVGRGRTG